MPSSFIGRTPACHAEETGSLPVGGAMFNYEILKEDNTEWEVLEIPPGMLEAMDKDSEEHDNYIRELEQMYENDWMFAQD